MIDLDLAEIQDLRDQGHTWQQIAERIGVSRRTLGRYLESNDTPSLALTGSIPNVKTATELLQAVGIDASRFELRDARVRSWQVKCAGEEVETLYGIAVNVLPRLSVEELQLPDTRQVTERPPSSRFTCTVGIPDTQHGFRQDRVTGKVTPLHDPTAIEVARQIVQHLREQGHLERLLLLGDHLDLAPWSKYPSTPDLCGSTTQALRALHADLVDLKEAGQCPIDWFEGNHEKRIRDFLGRQAPEAWDLRGVHDDEPVLSLPSLLRLDQLGVNYIGPYGTKQYYCNGLLGVYHGTKVGSRLGQVFEKHLTSSCSWLFGHVHQQGLLKHTAEGPGGAQEAFAMSPGTLSRVDGVVPQGGFERPSWQQGISVIWHDGHRLYPELVSIQNGRAFFMGKEFRV